MNVRRLKRLLLLACIAGSGAVFGAEQDDTIVLRLKWWHQFQFAGYYAAQAKGYYAEAGLKVKIEPGRPEMSSIDAVLGGQAQFGVNDSSIVLRRLLGQPVVACASILQHSADVVMSRQDRGIRTPADLAGARIMLAGAQGQAQLLSMLAKEGIPRSAVTIVPHTWRIDDLVAGHVDAMSAYATEEPYLLEKMAVPAAMLSGVDYGVDFYGDTLFTTEREIAAHPARTNAFIKASLRGWDYALKHPEEIADVILEMDGVRARGIDREYLLAEARAMTPYILPDLVELGHMNPGRWEKIARMFVEAGMAPAMVPLDDFTHSAVSVGKTGFIYVHLLKILGGIMAGALVVALWNLQVRRQVNQRTRQLKAEVLRRAQAEESANANAELLRMANRLGGMGAWAVTFPDKKVFWSEEVYRIHEVGSGYVPSLETALDFYPPASRAKLEQAIGKGDPYDLELEFITFKGNRRWVRTTSATEHENGAVKRVYGVFQDITDRRNAAETLAASEAQYRLLFIKNPMPMWLCEKDTFRFLAVNEAAVARFGYSAEEFLEMTLPAIRAPDADSEAAADGRAASAARFRAKDGSLLDVEAVSGETRFAGLPAILTMGHDVTELVHVNRAQRMLSACNEALIRAEAEPDLLHEICRVAVEIGGYRMAWVGFAQQDAGLPIRPVAHAGAEDGYLSKISLSWDETQPSGRGPAGRAIREGVPIISADIAHDDFFSPWRETALAHGYRSAVCLPLNDGRRTLGVLGLHSTESLAVGPREITLLRQLSDDLAFGIKTLRARIARQKTETAVLTMARTVSTAVGSAFFEKLTRGMVETLGADVGIVAMIDPGDKTLARTLCVEADGLRRDNFAYSLIGSPCEEVAPDEMCVIPRDVRRRFPASTVMAALGAEAYVGTPLVNADRKMTGIMAVVFRRPIDETDFIASTLRIFATRAASELDRQQVESRLREQAALLDKAQDAIIVRDLDHKVSYWNKSAQRLYGWSSEEAVGKSIAELLYKDTAAFHEATRQTLSNEEWIGELHQVTKAGTPIVVECRWTLVRDEKGAPRSILAINTDITERHRLEQQFLRAQRMESIGTLAGGIAHDLNNVLAPVIMAVDLLTLRETDPRKLSLLGTIAASARRGADMVGQVLSFARGVEGRRIEIQPRHLVHDIEKIVQETFPKNISVSTAVAPGLWAVTGDPTQLHQVLLNLCVNARDALPAGGSITISAVNTVMDAHYAAMNIDAKAGPYVVIGVEDTGTGIDPAIIEKIFDPFFTTKEVGKGTGLGLSTTLAIVKSHNGFIRVSSEPGRGARFDIHLPALPCETAAKDPNLPANLPRGEGECVLVIEDEAAIRNLNRQTLEAFGYRVILATDGAEGVSLYAQHRGEISAVLIDMMMPVMDGPAAIRALAQINPAVRVIAVSGISATAAQAKAAGAAVKHFLPKPYTTETLLRTIRSVIDAC